MTGVVVASSGCRGGGGGGGGGKKARGGVERRERQQQQLSMAALLMATIRKSMVYCRVNFREEDAVSAAAEGGIDIGWPTEVQHVAHVTFDRFKGFLGLPVEFELEVSCSAPSASASVFGVSAELMQCGFDSKGNSVPIILLLMQERLCSQGGLKAEGIFRINPENSEEKDLRNQLNKGIIPDDIDVHCLAGLIKAWFRELPEGVLDSLSPGQVLQCENEEDCVELVKLLPPMQFALVKWVVNLMADVVEEEEVNKMNARNIAMVFAPNMTQLSDPLTSLMHAVQVMNLLQTLIFRTLRERDEEAGAADRDWSFSCSPSLDCDGHETDESRESSSEDDCEVVVGATGDFQGFHYESSIDEGEIVEEIQECFLRHLEILDWDRGSKDAGRELVRPRMGCGYQETKFSFTQFTTSDSSVMISESNHINSSITVNDVDSVTLVPEVVRVATKPSEHDKELEMIADATKFSFTDHSSTSESSIMMSESSNHCNSSRTISDVDSVTVVPEDVRGDARPLEPVEDDKELEMVVDATKHCCSDSSISEPSSSSSESNRSNSPVTIDDLVPEDVAMDTKKSDRCGK